MAQRLPSIQSFRCRAGQRACDTKKYYVQLSMVLMVARQRDDCYVRVRRIML